MFKVLVVDDNNLVRQSIITTIDWSSTDCEIIGEAGNGLEAFELAKKHNPDLIVTDIRMPEMDGLELTERIKEYLPWVKVVIITGYDDFSYAQKAVKLGAFDLILKPVDNEELYSVVTRAIKELKKDTEARTEKEKMAEERRNIQNELFESIAELRKKFLIDMIQGFPLDENTINEKAKYLGLKFMKHAVFVIKPEQGFDKRSELQEKDMLKLINCSQCVLKSIESTHRIDITSFWFNFSLVVIAVPRKIDSDKSINIKMMEICSYISEYINKNADVSIIIGVSNVHDDVSEIGESYNEACTALDFRFFIDNKFIIHAGALKSRSILNEYPIMKKITMVYECIRSGDMELDSLLEEIFNEIRENETRDVGFVKSLLVDICLTSRRIIFEKGTSSNELLKSTSDIHMDISAFTSISQAFSYVREYVLQIYDLLNANSEKSYSSVTKKVLDYLNRNYDRKVTLQEIAEIVSLSPNHLSRIIKRDTGESFIDLFNNIKINIAVKMLKSTNLKVYEIANRVGIDNYAYFYQLFKKMTGISPSDYNK